MKTPQVPAMPGMAPLGFMRPKSVDQVALAKLKAAAPIKPTKPQEPLDFGLFSDDSLQTDLIESLRR